jgi:diacylglycerol kinase (ATP)
MRVAIVINPISGPRRVAAYAERAARMAREFLDGRALQGSIHVTRHPGHARSIAADEAARGTDTVIAWGGDGTVNEVGSALAFSGTTLAIVPAGSGNGLSRALGLPMRPSAALATAIDGASRPLDVGEIGGRLFFNVAGLGLDACIAHRFSLAPRRRGFLAYCQVAAAELWRHASERYAIQGEGFEHEGPALIVALANSAQYGNGAVIAPAARVDDGFLDLVVVAPASRIGNMLRARRLFDGSLLRDPAVWTRKVRALSIRAVGDLRFHVDGEPCIASSPIEARVHPGALTIRVPAGVVP